LKVTKGKITKGQKFQNLIKGQKLQKAEKGGKIQYSMGKTVEKFIHGESKRCQKIPLGFFLLVNSGLGWFVYGNHS
jgi:hypothetical protein